MLQREASDSRVFTLDPHAIIAALKAGQGGIGDISICESIDNKVNPKTGEVQSFYKLLPETRQHLKNNGMMPWRDESKWSVET